MAEKKNRAQQLEALNRGVTPVAVGGVLHAQRVLGLKSRVSAAAVLRDDPIYRDALTPDIFRPEAGGSHNYFWRVERLEALSGARDKKSSLNRGVTPVPVYNVTDLADWAGITRVAVNRSMRRYPLTPDYVMHVTDSYTARFWRVERAQAWRRIFSPSK